MKYSVTYYPVTMTLEINDDFFRGIPDSSIPKDLIDTEIMASMAGSVSAELCKVRQYLFSDRKKRRTTT